jgi:hypothetical protein
MHHRAFTLAVAAALAVAAPVANAKPVKPARHATHVKTTRIKPVERTYRVVEPMIRISPPSPLDGD